MSKVDDEYRIQFSTKDIKNFNQIFATFLLRSAADTMKTLPNFKITNDGEETVILLPADLEVFSFVAQLIQDVDEYTLTFRAEDEEVEEETTESNVIQSMAENIDFHEETEMSIENEATEVPQEVKRIEQSPQGEIKNASSESIKEYIKLKKTFTVKELKKHFPDATGTLITNTLYLAKKKGLIDTIGRGEYKVIS